MTDGEKLLMVLFLVVFISIVAYSVGVANTASTGVSGAITTQAPAYTPQYVGGGCGT